MTFDEADYYDCQNDSERLSCSTPQEALGEWIDGRSVPNCDMAALIAKLSPITVFAFTRKSVDATHVNRWAIDMVAQLNEWWHDADYGEPEGDDGPGDSALVSALTTAIDEAIKRTEVWACEESGEREYSETEVLELMRAEQPWWFEKKETP